MYSHSLLVSVFGQKILEYKGVKEAGLGKRRLDCGEVIREPSGDHMRILELGWPLRAVLI